MKPSKDLNKHRKAVVILILQVIAWGIAIIPFFEDYTSGNDAAGSGLAKGFALIFATIPSMVFIFFSSLYFVLKKDLALWYRLLSAANYVGLLILFNEVNW